MKLLAFDTATPATIVGVQAGGGSVVELRDDPADNSRGEHAQRLLELSGRALASAGLGFGDLDRIAVGVGPGGFTGLRIGIATARGLAQSLGCAVVAVSSLAALADAQLLEGIAAGSVAALIDARRGEAFVAAWACGARADGSPLLAPTVVDPDQLQSSIAALPAPVRAIGDGAIRFRSVLEAADAHVPASGSQAHRITAAALCRLGRIGAPVVLDHLLPNYLRAPDAKPSVQ